MRVINCKCCTAVHKIRITCSIIVIDNIINNLIDFGSVIFTKKPAAKIRGVIINNSTILYAALSPAINSSAVCRCVTINKARAHITFDPCFNTATVWSGIITNNRVFDLASLTQKNSTATGLRIIITDYTIFCTHTIVKIYSTAGSDSHIIRNQTIFQISVIFAISASANR